MVRRKGHDFGPIWADAYIRRDISSGRAVCRSVSTFVTNIGPRPNLHCALKTRQGFGLYSLVEVIQDQYGRLAYVYLNLTMDARIRAATSEKPIRD